MLLIRTDKRTTATTAYDKMIYEEYESICISTSYNIVSRAVQESDWRTLLDDFRKLGDQRLTIIRPPIPLSNYRNFYHAL